MTSSLRIPAMRIPSECTLTLPGSKSHANRAIVCACLASGRTVIRGATPCDDVSLMVENLRKMGFTISWNDKEKGELMIDGGLPAPTPNPSPEGGGEHRSSVKQSFLPLSGEGSRMGVVLDCGNAGTTIRFLSSVASRVAGQWTLTGDEHMRKRPIGDLTAALKSLGADTRDTNGCPPMHITGGTLKGGRVTLRADISSQYLTSLMLIAPTLPQGLKIDLEGELTSSGYVDLTMKVMKDFGISVRQEKNTFFIQSGPLSPTLFPRDQEKGAHRVPLHPEGGGVRGGGYDIEGDWSAAGAWLVLNALTGSTIKMPNLQSDSSQSDSELPSIIEKLKKSGDQTVDCSDVPDQTMNLAVLAAFRTGNTVLTGIANLRKKECDRIQVIATELTKAGIDIRERGDDLIVRGSGGLEKIAQGPVTLDPHDDHRMAMAFAILGLIRGNVTIKNPECVQKSYPLFFRDLEAVIRCTKPLSIVGMRGAGKSALGRKLASKLHLTHVDSDHLFVAAHGSIKDFIAANGWDEFRRKEEEIIASAIRSGIVLSLGGGALGSAKTRKLIKEKTIAVWLQAKESELIKRLESGKRPPLTDLPLHEEVRKFLLERGPHYREVAAMEVSPSLSFGEQVPFVLRTLRQIFLTS